jgi:hypothetical protein
MTFWCATLKSEPPPNKYVASSTPGDHTLFNNETCDHWCVDEATHLLWVFCYTSVAHVLRICHIAYSYALFKYSFKYPYALFKAIRFLQVFEQTSSDPARVILVRTRRVYHYTGEYERLE